MSYVVVGGTFDILHRGHKELIRKAFGVGDRVLICITSSRMAGRKPGSRRRRMKTYAERKAAVLEFLRENEWEGKADFLKIEDPHTDGLRPGLGYIVVSPGTRENAETINAMRRTRDLEELRIIEVDLVKAEDGRPISDDRIRKGQIDADGKLLK